MTVPLSGSTGPQGDAVHVLDATARPAGHRAVPLLAERDIGHYPEFRDFLAAAFGLGDGPPGDPGLVGVGDRCYEVVFVSRSGRPHPCGVEVNALVPGLEPLDEAVADTDLWAILSWLVDGVGGEWTSAALAETGRIYRIPAAVDNP